MGGGGRALVVAVVLVLWGVGEHQSLAGVSNPSPMPAPSLYPTPSIATVSSLCNGRNTVLGQWNFVRPYLLCYNHSLNSEGVQLFMESSTGFTRIRGAGGVFDANKLVRLGVPSSTATALVSGLHS
jgi:hypothetical protein